MITYDSELHRKNIEAINAQNDQNDIQKMRILGFIDGTLGKPSRTTSFQGPYRHAYYAGYKSARIAKGMQEAAKRMEASHAR